MARGINKAIIVGNLGNDPEIRQLPNGGAVANISVATSETWKDKQTGEQQERTEWHRIIFFDPLASIVSKYLRKGSKVYIEGRIQTRKWQDKNGQDRYTTEIVANEMQMLDNKGNGGSNSHSEEEISPSRYDSSSSPHTTSTAYTPTQVHETFDDDIPF